MKKRTDSYPLYFAAAVKAYEVLASTAIDKLPVDLEKVCKHYNIRVYYFSQATEIIELFELQRFCDANNCFCFCPDGKTNLILVDDNLNKKEQRLMIAHELGHILMDHLTLYNTEISSGMKEYYEMEADMFALTLLAPIPILSAIKTPNKHYTSTICDIPWYVANVVHTLLQNYTYNNAYTQIAKYIIKLLQSFYDFIIQQTEVRTYGEACSYLYSCKFPRTSPRRI